MVNESERQYHPVSAIFPMMTEQEYKTLKEDIGDKGLLESIWLHPDGSIVDGRNRHSACVETGRPPRFRTWNGKGSLVDFVVSLNLHRRHLTKSQKAAAALEALPLLEAEARKRQATSTGGAKPQLTQKVAEAEKGESRAKAAKLFDTNRQYVSDAKKIQEQEPEIFQEVKSGKITIPQAKREITKRNRSEPPPLPSSKYRVFYADPPWSYGNSGIIGDDHYGHVKRHYPDMSIGELCEMGEKIKEIAEKDAVLWLWVTSPLLEECFAVIKAWGFKYKTSFVWDKIGHNYGHYNSVRHELLLICTRGSCTPDEKRLFDSVQSIQKSKKHSEKPQEFRGIIDTLYTHGRKLELFAREQHEGWEAWGNEPETR